MNRFVWGLGRCLGIASVVVLLAAPAGIAAAQDDPGWQRILPGGETRCSWDTPFHFFARDGASDNLLIFFQGGGACWDAASCSGTRYLREAYGIDQPPQREGILDMDNPENPFFDYDILYIPTCTGDVFTGNTVNTYTTDDGQNFTIYHRGFVDAQVALEWAYEQFAAPESVFIAGCSAGSLGSIVHAPYIIEHYQPARVTHLGDGAGGYRGTAQTVALQAWNTVDAMPGWLPELASMTPEPFAFEKLFTVPAAAYPDVIFSQVNRKSDPVQAIYIAALGLMPYAEALAENHAQIEAGTDSFRYYTAWGSGHCLIDSPDFYRMQTNGVRLRDWVAGLAAGQPVENIECVNCTTPEWYTP